MNDQPNLPAVIPPSAPEPEFDFNAVDELMRRVDEINAKDPTELTEGDLAVLVGYHRRNRQRKAQGVKPTRGKTNGGMSLAELLNQAPVKLSTRPASALPAPEAKPPTPPAPTKSGLRRF